MELEAVDEAVRGAYVPSVVKDAAVHVELVTPETTNVMVTGAVTAPGLVALRRTERNLMFAIVGAGGASNLASGRVTLRRIRRPTEQVTLDLTDPTQLRAALALKPLQNGDIVNVHAATPNTIFVGGLVNAPSPQPYAPGVEVSVLQAIAAAGGLRTDIYPKEGTLIRRMPDGKDAHVKLELDRIADGRDPNILLAAGDVLWVPHTFETRVQDFINRNIFLRAGVTVNYSVTGIEFLNRHKLQAGRYGGDLEDSYDPFGFLTRGAAIQTLATSPTP
jgi:protein involved in polysaccharide export with SLBB domain